MARFLGCLLLLAGLVGLSLDPARAQVQKKKLPYNPMLTVTRQEGGKKRQRRALSPEQFQKLAARLRVRHEV